MRFPTAGEITRNAVADAAKIGMDSRFWNPFVAFLAHKGFIPKTIAGRIALIGGASAVGAVIQANVGEDTLVSKVVNEVASDLASEVGSRILHLPPGSATPKNSDSGIRSGLETLTARLNGWAGR